LVDAVSHHFLGVVLKIDNRRAFILPANVIFEDVPGLQLLTEDSAATAQIESEDESLEDTEVQLQRETYPLFFGAILPSHVERLSGYNQSLTPQDPLTKPASEDPWTINKRSQARQEWEILEPRIEDIIRQTPAKSTIIPRIAVQCIMGKDADHGFPAVTIACDSPAYSKQLKRVINKSEFLSGTNFKLNIVDDTTPKPSQRWALWASGFRAHQPNPSDEESLICLTTKLSEASSAIVSLVGLIDWYAMTINRLQSVYDDFDALNRSGNELRTVLKTLQQQSVLLQEFKDHRMIWDDRYDPPFNFFLGK